MNPNECIKPVKSLRYTVIWNAEVYLHTNTSRKGRVELFSFSRMNLMAGCMSLKWEKNSPTSVSLLGVTPCISGILGVSPPGLVQYCLQHSCVIACQAFSPYVYLASMKCICITVSMTSAWKKLHFILSVSSDFHMTNSRSIAVHAFACRMLTSFSFDESLLPKLVNLSTSFRELPFSEEILPLWLKHMYSLLSALTWRPMLAAAHFRPCSRLSVWVGVFARSAMSSA